MEGPFDPAHGGERRPVPRPRSRSRSRAGRPIVILAAGLLAACLPPPRAAVAHAILIDSDPATGATLPAGPYRLRLRFNSRIDHARSRLTLAGSDNSPVVLDIAADSPIDELRADAVLPPGDDMVRWQVLAIDGHITRGEVDFRAVGIQAAH